MIEHVQAAVHQRQRARRKTGELILPEFLVVTKNGIRFGIVSVLDPQQKIITMNPDEGEFRVDDPVTTLRQVLPRLRGLCDTVVLLAHTGEPWPRPSSTRSPASTSS